MIHHRGIYYWCETARGRGVVVHESHDLVSRGRTHLAWRAPARGPFSHEVWAPELHRFDGRWYIYVAASNGQNCHHRMIVLEGRLDKPTGPFSFRSTLYTGDDVATGADNRWAIDGTVLEYRGARYFLWSGWADERDEQRLYIARMENPWTIATNRVRLCANDDHLWERVGESPEGRGLNEAPQVLARDGRVFVVFSASASWQHSYKLGMLELARDGDPLDPGAWRKHSEPVFQSTRLVCGVGHCSFTHSPDGTQHWIAFHAKIHRRDGWQRAIHVQEFRWSEDGLPVFGKPGRPGMPLVRPSGCVLG